jgi:hypothetical protein
MHIKTDRTASLVPALIALIAILYVSWQLIGIRFENHDDIYFHLYSRLFADDYSQFAKDTAYLQARAQAFINMPLILWANSFQASPWFDVINLSAFAFLYGALIYFFSAMCGRPTALILAAATLLVFPLHYYFTFPQGYPVMGSYGLALALLAAALLASYLKKPTRGKRAASVILFTCSLWGPEYNFVLHPIFLLIALYSTGVEKDLKALGRLAWPYALGWLVSVAAYLLFSTVARETGGDAYGRVTFGLDFPAWAKTFLILQEKAFLPIGLLKGVAVAGATAQGVPDMPSAISYLTLVANAGGWKAIASVFFPLLVLSYAVLHYQNLGGKSARIVAVFFVAMAAIPALVVSASTHYQKIVLAGWLQGHLVAFYSHLGLAGLLFLLCAAISRSGTAKMRPLAMMAAAILLASYATATLIYNNVNRQAMMANKQKWDAAGLLVSYVRVDRPDLIGSKFYAPAFWNKTGVASVPGDRPVDGANYWTLYSASVLGQKLLFLNESLENGKDGIGVSYFSTPEANPLIYLEEYRGGSLLKRVAVAAHPMAGILRGTGDGLPLKHVSNHDWTCTTFCTVNLVDISSTPLPSPGFTPDAVGKSSLLAQFLMPRYTGYGNALGAIKDISPLVVENWGPQASKVNEVPNLQPSGDAGIWIKLTDERLPGDVQVIVGGRPAKQTTIAPGLVTAAVDPSLFQTIGNKAVAIYNLKNGSTTFVGDLTVGEK